MMTTCTACTAFSAIASLVHMMAVCLVSMAFGMSLNTVLSVTISTK